jgi:hypothetical protein
MAPVSAGDFKSLLLGTAGGRPVGLATFIAGQGTMTLKFTQPPGQCRRGYGRPTEQ